MDANLDVIVSEETSRKHLTVQVDVIVLLRTARCIYTKHNSLEILNFRAIFIDLRSKFKVKSEHYNKAIVFFYRDSFFL